VRQRGGSRLDSGVTIMHSEKTRLRTEDDGMLQYLSISGQYPPAALAYE